MEYLRCSEEIKRLPKDANFTIKAKAYMEQEKIRSLQEDGFLKVLKGITTVEEVVRVTG